MQQELEYIYRVYQEKNFTRAAEKLYITQPALSMAVQKVEERLGMPIFDRSERPLSLTEAGRAYIAYIEETKNLEDELSRKVLDIRELNAGSFRLGGSHYVNAYILPKVLSGFAARYPRISFDLMEASSAELGQMLSERKIDLTFNCNPAFVREFDHFPAFRDTVLLAVPKDLVPRTHTGVCLSAAHVLAGHHLEESVPAADLRDFQDVPFLLLYKGNNLYERGMRLFEEAGVTPRVRMNLSQLVTAYRMADAGLGAAFVSDRIIREEEENLRYFRLDSENATRQFYMLVPKRNYVSSAVRRFIEYTAELLEEKKPER